MQVLLQTYPNPTRATLHFDQKVSKEVIDFILNLTGVLSVEYAEEWCKSVYSDSDFVVNEYSLELVLANQFFKSVDILEAVQNRFCR